MTTAIRLDQVDRRPSRKYRRQRVRGFSLLEILIVVVIIGVLAVLIVPNVVGRGEQARVTAAKADIRSIANALEFYRLDNSHYPSAEQGLEALVSRPTSAPTPRNWGPEAYLKNVPIDPWGYPYGYTSDGLSLEVFSLGADGQEGGEEYASDIFLSELN